MRISGVRVGKVKKKERERRRPGLTDTVLEIDARYAPIPKDTRAILRQKTLLGETYVELSPGDRSGRAACTTAASSPPGQVADTVQLDEILRTFDPETRRPSRSGSTSRAWRRSGNAEHHERRARAAHPVRGGHRRGAEGAARSRAAPRSASCATPAYVFDALSERKGQLRDLIRNSNRVWETIASRDAQLADTFRVLPDLPARGPHDHRSASRSSPTTPTR